MKKMKNIHNESNEMGTVGKRHMNNKRFERMEKKTQPNRRQGRE